MKYIGWLVFILICFPLGQAFHRVAALEALGGDSGPEGADAEGRQKLVFSSGGSQLEVWIDPASVRESELPESVTLKRRMEVSSADRASVVPLEKDAVVRILEKSGNNLTVSALSGPLTGIVPVSHTDLLEQVVKLRAARVFGTGDVPVAKVPSVPSTPAAPPVSPPVAAVNPPAMGGGAMAETPPAPVAPPEPEPAPVEPEEPEAPSVPVDVVKLMQESIKAGSVKEFTFDQVQAWKAGEEETVDGESYQVGLAAYKAETIFGVKTVQAKALIKGGKLVKWVYAKTGMEIR